MVVGIAANMSFNVIDTYFVAQIGVDALSAISFSFPVVIVLLNLSIGLGIGVSSVLSRLLGKEESSDEVSSLAGLAFVWGSVLAAVLVGLGIATIGPLFEFLGASARHMPYITDYMKWAYAAMGLRMVSIIISGVFRAYGKTSIPSLVMTTTSVLNLILDPLLIFGYGPIAALGIEGAGIATFLANFAAFLLEAFLAWRVFRLLDFGISPTAATKKRFADILTIGLPASCANALNPLSIGLGNYLLSLQSAQEVAGFGVASKIQIFSMIPTFALSAALAPIFGQNLGGGHGGRVRKALWYSLFFSLLWGAVQGLGLSLFASAIVAPFTDDAAASSWAIHYLKVVSWSLFGYSFVVVISALFNASGRPWMTFSCISLRTFILFLPSYFIFSWQAIEAAITWSYTFANSFAAVLSLLLASAFLKRAATPDC